MSINDKLPVEVESAIRKLRDEDNLVDVIWGCLAFYSDQRWLQARQDIPKRKKDAYRVMAAVRELKGAIALTGDKTPQELKTIETKWSKRLDRLESIPGRSTRNKSLTRLVESLLSVFSTYDIPARKLSGFLKVTLPSLDDAAPSRAAIDAEIKEVRTSQ